MRILFLTHAFTGLTQRLFVELGERGHDVSIEFDIADSVAEEAVALFRPELILAPYLRRAIPESIWSRHVCLVVHPGIVGDRGPSSLDWAIQEGEEEWGVTVLQANAVMDGGDVWAAERFAMRAGSKSSLFRNEVTETAVRAVLLAIERFAARSFTPRPLAAGDPGVRGRVRPLMRPEDRAIDWSRHDTATVLRHLAAADGFPGVRDAIFGAPCLLFDARREPVVAGQEHEAGAIVGRRGDALVRATIDGAVRIGHVRRLDVEGALKLPAAVAFAELCAELPLLGAPDDIRYEEEDGVGYLHFDFYNGAMSTDQCARLCAALLEARSRPTSVLVLTGGEDHFSNGIHLHRIEAAASPADESWRNIQAMDDLALALLEAGDQITVAALQGGAGAGGAFLALAADEVWARRGVLLNPHYKNMGNLYGSEYWTYSLPRRIGEARAHEVLQGRLPLGAAQAVRAGLADACFGDDLPSFRRELRARAAALAASPSLAARLADKRERRRRDEATRPLADYRAAELAEMHRNFYGFDPSYHYARHHFVRKVPHAWTPRHLARHRDPARSSPPPSSSPPTQSPTRTPEPRS